MTDNFIFFTPNPASIEKMLAEANLPYVNSEGRDQDWAFSQTAVIPQLMKWMATQNGLPDVKNARSHLLRLRNSAELERRLRAAMEDEDPGARLRDIANQLDARAGKLTQDAFREWHTYGLLLQSGYFQAVRYSKIEDIDAGIDYVVWMGSGKQVGIQAAMRARWDNDQFTDLKRRRVQRRVTNYAPPSIPIYWLTNQHIPANTHGRCWLFRPQHITALVSQIEGDLQPNLF